MRIKFIRFIIALLFCAASTVTASAQTRIKNMIKEIKNKHESEIIFSQKRDPKTRKIVSQSFFFESSDKSLYKRMLKAFREDSEESLTYSQAGSKVITMQFIENGRMVNYSLIVDVKKWIISTNAHYDPE